MRHVSLLALALFAGCAQQSPLHAPCMSERECPAGFVCQTSLRTCEVPCDGMAGSNDCEGLGGNGAAVCTTVGLCNIRCFINADCPAPLQCPRGGGDCVR